MVARMDGWTDRQTDRLTEGRTTDGRTDGQRDIRMDINRANSNSITKSFLVVTHDSKRGCVRLWVRLCVHRSVENKIIIYACTLV